MTTIAWDGKHLATDGRMTTNGIVRSENTEKLFRIGDAWFAGCGTYEDVLLAVQWYRNECPSTKPTLSDGFAALIQRGEKCFRVERGLIEWEVVELAATGSGFELALGAMAAGATAAEAVRIAARFDTNTNDRVKSTADPQ